MMLRNSRFGFNFLIGICTVCFLPYGLGTGAAGEELEENLFPDEKVERPPDRANRFVVGPEQIDACIFGNVVRRDQSGISGSDRLESLLSARCESIASVVSLSQDQVSKLRLAGHGDIHRFMEKVDEVRIKFDAVRNDQEKMNQMWQEVQPLQQQVQAGLFGTGSLFNKVLSEILDDQQLYDVRTDEEKRLRFGYQARIWRAVAQLERSTPLTKEQRDKLLELLLATPPPLRFGQQDHYYVLWQLSKIPEEKIKPLFDEAQWKIILLHRQQGDRMAGFLKSNKMVPADTKDDS